MAFLPCTLVAAPWSHRLFQRTWCRTCCLYRPGWWSSLLLRIIAIEFANRFVKPRRLGLRWIASRWVPALNQEKLEQYQNVLSVITLNTIFVKIDSQNWSSTQSTRVLGIRNTWQLYSREFIPLFFQKSWPRHVRLIDSQVEKYGKKVDSVPKKALGGIIRYKDYKDQTAAALCPSILASESSCPSRNQLQRAHNLHTIREKWTFQKEI